MRAEIAVERIENAGDAIHGVRLVPGWKRPQSSKLRPQHGRAGIYLRALAFSLSVALLVLPGMAGAKDTFTGVARIVAVGDVHGDLGQFERVLASAGVLDANGRWSGGRTHLVQLGDVPDRGPDTSAIIELLMRLEKEARRAGGRVHALIGNHEAMNVVGDLRFVHPGEYAALVDKRSGERRRRYLEVYVAALEAQGQAVVVDDEFMAAFDARFPPGWIEHRTLWEAGGRYARWIAKHNAVIRINDVLFAHGGLNPHVPHQPLKQINRDIRRALRKTNIPFLMENDNTLWYRGLALNDAETEVEALEALLTFHDAARIVVAHSPTRGAVTPRLGGRVILADVGLSAHYGARLACLVIENGQYFAIHRGVKIPLPLADEGRTAYLERTAALNTPSGGN